MIEQFTQWVEHRHDYAREWKAKTGGKVMGYFCTYVPEEILHAAGVLPVRILGSHEPQDVTEPHIFPMFCPFCRDCLAQGLKGRFDYLDGIMISQSCLHIRQAFTSWQKHVPVEFSYYLNMPHRVRSPHAHTYLTGELEDFKQSVEKWTGNTITDDGLKESIAVYNDSRDCMRRTWDLRKSDPPPLTGEQAMYLALSQQMTAKEEHTNRLKALLPELESTGGSQGGIRLMLIGSEDDDLQFIRMVEKVGGMVVTDEHCTGTRYFWNQAVDNGDPLASIAARYLDRPPCPSKDWEERQRIPHILDMARAWDVKGALIIQQKFCDPHELDVVAIKKALEDAGIKTLFLEFDVTVPVGQFQVRVEAFLEMLSDEDLF
jgi:benzoyl-CoA reductase subunit C